MKKQLLSALTLILIAQNLGANEVGNDAYLENDVVKIPVVSIGESNYRLDLQLVPGSSPVQLKMVAAEDITELKPSTSGASTFVDNILTIPFLANTKASYKIELELISTSPTVILELKNASVAAWVNRSEILNALERMVEDLYEVGNIDAQYYEEIVGETMDIVYASEDD